MVHHKEYRLLYLIQKTISRKPAMALWNLDIFNRRTVLFCPKETEAPRTSSVSVTYFCQVPAEKSNLAPVHCRVVVIWVGNAHKLEKGRSEKEPNKVKYYSGCQAILPSAKFGNLDATWRCREPNCLSLEPLFGLGRRGLEHDPYDLRPLLMNRFLVTFSSLTNTWTDGKQYIIAQSA